MLTKVQKWGNSLALRIPKSFAADAQIKVDSVVELSMVDGQIIVKPVVAPKLTIEGLLSGVNPENIHHEIEAGDPVGNEVWVKYGLYTRSGRHRMDHIQSTGWARTSWA